MNDNNPSSKLLIASTVFTNLSGSPNGLTINFVAPGEIIQYHTYNMHSVAKPIDRQYSTHSYTSISSKNSSNFMIESSISFNSCHFCPFWHSDGNFIISMVNVTNNDGMINSGGYTSNSNVSCCNIINNTSSGHRIFHTGPNNCNLKYMKFVNNKNSGFGLVFSDQGDKIVEKSILMDNNCEYLFQVLMDGTIKVNECYFNNNIAATQNSDLVIVSGNLLNEISMPLICFTFRNNRNQNIEINHFVIEIDDVICIPYAIFIVPCL